MCKLNYLHAQIFSMLLLLLLLLVYIKSHQMYPVCHSSAWSTTTTTPPPTKLDLALLQSISFVPHSTADWSSCACIANWTNFAPRQKRGHSIYAHGFNNPFFFFFFYKYHKKLLAWLSTVSFLSAPLLLLHVDHMWAPVFHFEESFEKNSVGFEGSIGWGKIFGLPLCVYLLHTTFLAVEVKWRSLWLVSLDESLFFL
jgi:hypothetical protein